MSPELVALVLIVGGLTGVYIFRNVLLKALIVIAGLAVMVGIGYAVEKYFVPSLDDKTALTISIIVTAGGGLFFLTRRGS